MIQSFKHWERIKTFYMVLLIILMSGSVIFSKMYYIESIIVFFVSSVLFFFPKIINKKNFLLYTLFCTILFINMICYQKELTGYVGLVLKLTAVLFMANRINIELAAHYFLKIIIFLAITSIPFYLLGLLFPEFIRSFIPLTEVWGGQYRITPLYAYNFWNFNRNNGVYWEPGAFQIFLNIGLILNFKYKIQNQRIYLIILTIAIFTTFSTAGYITAALIYLIYTFKHILKKPRILAGGVLFALLFLFIENKVGVISNKFSDDNYSYTRRTMDTASNIDLMFKKPFLGWGFQNNEVLLTYYNLKDSSNALFQFGYQFGFVLFLILIVHYFFQMKRVSTSLFETVGLFIILYLMLSNQNLIFHPVFLCVFFFFSNKGLSQNKIMRYGIDERGKNSLHSTVR